MNASRARLRAPDAAGAVGAAAAVLAIVVLALLGERKFGLWGLTAPLAVALLIAMARRPAVAVVVTVGLTIVCEDSSFGVSVMPELYKNLYGGIEPLDLLVTITFFSVAYDLVRRRRQPRLPRIPALALTLVVLAMLGGIAVGNGNGTPIKQALLSVHTIVEFVVMTFAVYNLDLTEAQLVRTIRWAVALAAVKAVVGLVVMLLGLSTDLDSGTNITYYQPTANWVMMVAMFGLLARALGGRAPRWSRGHERLDDLYGATRGFAARRGWGVRASRLRALRSWLRARPTLLLAPLLIAGLLLSYRRSFWIASVLGLIILIPLGATRRKRLMIVPCALLIAGAIWAVSSLPFQAQTPIFERAQSLNPTKLQSNAQDRYRLDERANVVAEIKHQPVTGLGIDVPWVATVRSLGVEHVGGRNYVHFALLWWWLKLGILGAVAYLGLLISMAILSIQTWRRHTIPELRYFGIASVCAVAGLVAIETTATFTGVDARFSVMLGAQFGLLAALAQRGSVRTPTPPVAGAPAVEPPVRVPVGV